MPARASQPSLPHESASPALLGITVVALFSAWSLSFIAIEALVSGPGGRVRFDWLSLTVARFVPSALLCGLYCLLFRRREALDIIRSYWPRLIPCSLLVVPVYNFALGSALQGRVAAPVASLLTALAPLFVMVLSALFLGERITRRRAAGFALAMAGLILIALARRGTGTAPSYPLWIAVTALAPLSWSVHTVLTKPISREVSPLVWTYLIICLGTVPLLFVLPFSGGPELLALDAAGWAWLGHLVLLCTVLGFATWTWLLVHLPATSVGFTVFLNPPMTTGYKLLLALAFPASFQFTVVRGEWTGGLVMLAAVALAIGRPAADRSADDSGTLPNGRA